jgi:hypothetical protein
LYGPIPVAPQEDMPMPSEPMQMAQVDTSMGMPIDIPTPTPTPTPMPGVKPLVSGTIPTRTPQEAAIETRDAGVSLVKGAVQGFLGLPGDLEALLYGVVNMANDEQGKGKLAKFLDGLHKDTLLPTTEKIKQFVDSNNDYFKGLKDNPFQTVGEIVAPAGQIKLAKEGFKSATSLIKNSAIGKVDTGILKTNPDFKTWFGDSKIVDGNNNPVILYHGTMKDFSEFKTPNEVSSKNMGGAIWLTSDKEFANVYSMEFNKGKPTKGGQVIPVYVQMNNPYPAYKLNEGVPSSIDDVKKLQAQGYDGVHLKNTKGRSIYLAFTNDQISPALSVPMDRKITETASMKFDRQTKKLIESMQK